MVIGKTNSSMSVDEMLQQFSETDILCSVFDITKLPCKISSPLREDKHPSFELYLDKGGHVRFRDFATMENGGLFDLLMRYWNCSFSTAMTKISQLFVEKNSVDVKLKHLRTFTRVGDNGQTSVQVAIRPWRDYDYEYWRSYGIEPKWLRYAEVYPISHKIIIKKFKDRKEKYVFPADDLAFVFVERKNGNIQLKVYQPYNKDGYKWCSQMDGSVISLWTKVPEYGDRIVICSSLKDALVISCQLHIPAIALQGEGYDMSDTAINELKRRYKKIYISFDTDKWGIADSKRLAERTGFINVIPDLGKQKDFSDFFKSLKNKQLFKQLETLFN